VKCNRNIIVGVSLRVFEVIAAITGQGLICARDVMGKTVGYLHSVNRKVIKMEYEEIKNRLAPCGLHCGKCFAFSDGDIVESSRQLKASLGNFDVYAERFVELLDQPVFKKYPAFKEMLDLFSMAGCSGCRKENCKLFKNCKVRSCSEQKGVDFCFQCSDFPCGNTGFDEHLNRRSVAINRQMAQIGIEKYYDEIKDEPRY